MQAAHIGRIPWVAKPSFDVVKAFRGATDHVVAAAGWLRRASCGLSGHDMIWHFEPGRVSLECMRCGERSPGWALQPNSQLPTR